MSSLSPHRRNNAKPTPVFSQYAFGSRSYNDLAARLQTAYVQRGGVTLDVTEIESFLFEAGITSVDTSLLTSFVLTVRRGILRGQRDGGAKEEVGRSRPRPVSKTSITATTLLDPTSLMTSTTPTNTRPMSEAMEIMALVEDMVASDGQSLLSSGLQNSPTADVAIPAGGLKRRKSISQLRNNEIQGGGGGVEGSGAMKCIVSPTSAQLYMAMFVRETSSALTIPSSSPATGGSVSRERSASGIHRQSSRSGGRALPPLRQGGDGFGSTGRRLLPGGGTFPTRLSAQDRLDIIKKIQNTFRCHLESHPSRTAAIPITARSTTVPLPMLIELGIICIIRAMKRATLASQADEAARVVWSACGMDESSLPAAAGKKLRSLSIVSQDSSSQSTSKANTQLPLSVLREHIVSRFFTSPIPVIEHDSSSSELGDNSSADNRRKSSIKQHRAPSTNIVAGATPNVNLGESSSTSTAPPQYLNNAEEEEEAMLSAQSMMTPVQDTLHDDQTTLSTSLQLGESSRNLISSSSGVRPSKSLSSQLSADLPSFVQFVGKLDDLTATAAFVAPQSPTFEGGGRTGLGGPSSLQPHNYMIGAHARRSLSYENSTGGGGVSPSEPTLSFEDLRNLLAEAADDSSLLIALVFNHHRNGIGIAGDKRGSASDSFMHGSSGVDISRSENLIEKRQQLAKLLSVQQAVGGSKGDGRPESTQLGSKAIEGGGGGPMGHLPPAARHLAQQISSDLRSDLLSEDGDIQRKIALLLHGSLLPSPSSRGGNRSGGLPLFSIPQRKSSPAGASGAAQKWNKLFALASGDASHGIGIASSEVSNSTIEYQQIQECEMTHMDVLECMLGVGPLSTPKRIRAVIRALAAFGRALERGREKRKRQGGGVGANITGTVSPSKGGGGVAGSGSVGVPTNFSNMPSPIKNHFRSVLQATLASGTFLHNHNQKKQDVNGESMSMTLPLDGGDSRYSDLRRQLNYALQTHITPYLKLTQPALRSPRGGAISPRFSDDDRLSADGIAACDKSRHLNVLHNASSSPPPIHSPVGDRLAKLQAQLDAVRKDKTALLLQDTRANAVGTEVAPFRASTIGFTGNKKKKPFKRRMVDRGTQTDFDPNDPFIVQ